MAWLVAPKRARRSVLIVGSIAGDEPGGIEVATALASAAAISGVRLWLIPDMNPDGAARGTRANADGVDLNRNFPFAWRRLGKPGSRYYSGTRPASEPETRAVEAFILVSAGLRVSYSNCRLSTRSTPSFRNLPSNRSASERPFQCPIEEGPRWAERLLAQAIKLPLERLPDYPGSAIGWDDHVVPDSAFDVELPGGQLSGQTVRRYATGIRSLVLRFADHRLRRAR